MAFIYCIVNNINGKKYIGKTSFSIERRFKQHINDSTKSCEKRPLYSAIRKYGKENFSIYALEETTDEKACEREIFWIKEFNTVKNGYNATIGGDGKPYIDQDKILREYEKLKRASLVARKLKHDEAWVAKILNKHGVKLENHPYDSGVINKPKKIYRFSKEGFFIDEFESVTKAVEFLYDNGLVKNKKSGVRGHICDNANGKKKSAYGYIWKYELT